MLQTWKIKPRFFFDRSIKSMSLRWLNVENPLKKFRIVPGGEMDETLRFYIMNTAIRILKYFDYGTEYVLEDADKTIAAWYNILSKTQNVVVISSDFDMPLLGTMVIRKICTDSHDVYQQYESN